MVLDCQRTLRNGILHRSHHKDTTFPRLSPNISPPFFPSFFPPRQQPYCVRQQPYSIPRHPYSVSQHNKATTIVETPFFDLFLFSFLLCLRRRLELFSMRKRRRTNVLRNFSCSFFGEEIQPLTMISTRNYIS